MGYVLRAVAAHGKVWGQRDPRQSMEPDAESGGRTGGLAHCHTVSRNPVTGMGFIASGNAPSGYQKIFNFLGNQTAVWDLVGFRSVFMPLLGCPIRLVNINVKRTGANTVCVFATF